MATATLSVMTLSPAAKLVWFSTARRDETPAGIKKTWRTKCGRYQVTTFVRTGADFSAWVRDGAEDHWRLLSRHRKSDTAVRACCSHAKGAFPE